MTHEAITKDALDVGLITGLLIAGGLALGFNWPGLLMCLLGVTGYSVAAHQVGEDRGIGRGAASSVPASCTAPASYTISSDEPTFAAGEGALALLTFSPTTQDQNCVTMGVSSANISGNVGIGSAQ